MSNGAKVRSSGGDDGDHAKEVGDEADRHTPAEEGRTLVGVEIGGPRVSHLDFWSGVEALVVFGRGSASEVNSGSNGGGGDAQSGSPQRDSEMGKDPMVVEDPSGGVSTVRWSLGQLQGLQGTYPLHTETSRSL